MSKLEIKPYILDEQVVDDFSYLDEPLPRPPFRMFVWGRVKSGKTTFSLRLITDLLCHPDGSSIFDKIYIFSPSALFDKTFRVLTKYDKFNVDNMFLTNILNKELIDKEIIGQPNEGKNILVLIDDFANSKKELQDSVMYDLFFRSRHVNTSIIFTSQYFYQCPKQERQQMNYMVDFDQDDNSYILKQELSNSRNKIEDMPEIFDRAFEGNIDKGEHNFLYVDRVYGKFYRNLDKEIKKNTQIKEDDRK